MTRLKQKHGTTDKLERKAGDVNKLIDIADYNNG